MLTLVIWMKSLLTVGKQSRGYLTVLGISHQRGVEGRGQKDVGEESEGCGGGIRRMWGRGPYIKRMYIL